jgi:hypothetical protein
MTQYFPKQPLPCRRATADVTDPARATAEDLGPGSEIAAAIATWLEMPDVLADPDQTDAPGGLVWTRVEDVLPGSAVLPEQELRAAWGDTVWLAAPHWDSDEIGVLWLRPLTEPIGLNDLLSACRRIRAAAEPYVGRQGGDTADAAPVGQLVDLTLGLVNGVELLLSAASAGRRRGRAAWRASAAHLRPKQRRRLLHTEALIALSRSCRAPSRIDERQ